MRIEGHTIQSNPRQRHFVFSAEDLPRSKFDFTRPSTAFLRYPPPKRIRSTTDVDGEGSGSVHSKKRRLRLDLVTSRLSQPFATPTTNIVTRGFSTIAIRARKRALGKHALRKAAILNSIKKKNPSSRKIGIFCSSAPPQSFDVDEACEKWEDGECTVGTAGVKGLEVDVSRNNIVGSKGSSLGVSDYEALDQEDTLYDEIDESSDDCESVYSDFSIRDTSGIPSEEYDFLTSPDPTASKIRPRMEHLGDLDRSNRDEDTHGFEDYAEYEF